MENNNIITMEFIGVDNGNNDVYKCVETGILYKDGKQWRNLKPELYSCGNSFDGECGFPIDSNLEINFIGVPIRPTEQERFNYQLLDRLRSDCVYYLGYGNRNEKHLWAGNEQEQINKMKELYNSFSDDKKPEWLTYEQILQFEKLLINN